MTLSGNTATLWEKLERLGQPTLAELFEVPGRLDRYCSTLHLPGAVIRFDWSKTHLTQDVDAILATIAGLVDLSGKRDQLFRGETINLSEGRAAEHTAQRGIGAPASVVEAEALHLRMRCLVEAIHAGLLGEVKSLVHIGIGGSALGPALAIDALARGGGKAIMGKGADRDALAAVRGKLAVHVVSNVDGCALEGALEQCDPATTLVAIASKTFTTTETMINAASALEWLREGGVDDPYGRVIALTASPDKAVDWGLDETRVLPFPETVGGRYSLWSAIGFPIALALGWSAFAELLEGAASIDRHFIEAPDEDNVVIRAAFSDLYYAQARRCPTRGVFVYDERLRLFPNYLQQLEMESNGKWVTVDGAPLDRPSAPITWGGVGTDAQHAVFQLLYQGKHLVPTDFIAVKTPGHDLDPAHHRALLSNCFAQGAALMAGKASDDGARAYLGDRPSATILCDALNPATLGALIAFYEHRTFVSAMMLGINPFDQFGVELGKSIARKIEKGGDGFDPSTSALLDCAGLKW